MNNRDKLATLVKPETRALDLGLYADAYAGQTLDVQVNVPGVLEAIYGRAEGARDYAAERAVVAALFDLPAETVATLDDTFLMWLFVEGTRIYTEYHAALKKKSSDH